MFSKWIKIALGLETNCEKYTVYPAYPGSIYIL